MNRQRESSVRNLQALGINLQKIMKRLQANQELLRYLHYTDQDPLATDKEDVNGKDLYEKQIRIVPVVGKNEQENSIITIKVLKGVPNLKNTEFKDIYFSIEIFVPYSQWVLKSDNLRPYLIMGEIERSLQGLKINGLGAIESMTFTVNFFTEQVSAHEMFFSVTHYD